MLKRLHPSFKILAQQDAATKGDVEDLHERYESVPAEYAKLVREATDIELEHDGETYVRIWGPDGVIDQDESYGITRQLPGSLPIGDDGGCTVLLYMKGKEGFGLYLARYEDMFVEQAVWVAPSLEELLVNACGIYPGWFHRKENYPQYAHYRTGEHLKKYNLPWNKDNAKDAGDKSGKGGKK